MPKYLGIAASALILLFANASAQRPAAHANRLLVDTAVADSFERKPKSL